MKKLILSIVLVIVAIVLFTFLLPFAIVWGIVASFWQRKLKNGTNELSTWFYAWASSIDQLGKNKKLGTLSKIGKKLDWLLDKLDPNHSINSIEIDEY
ncbi:MAG: hypothetical protein ACWIPI_05830 [Polaribacter sp.]